jgi:molybdopterin molybdotransferase
MAEPQTSYKEALIDVLDNIRPLDTLERPLSEAAGYFVGQDLYARVDSPSVSASTKDGYAVQSADVDAATESRPVSLECIGLASAGHGSEDQVSPGTAIRILTGAPIPQGSDAVLAEEFTRKSGDALTATAPAGKGRNILKQGFDITDGELMLERGICLTPGKIGLLAASGISMVLVHRRPKVLILSTGDEVVLPGRPLAEGQLYASNMMTLHAVCRSYGFDTRLVTVGDDAGAISEQFSQFIRSHDAVLTSGGAWSGDRDFMARVLEELRWEKIFHRLRLGPGKAAGFGLLTGKPVFILPGGPPSNLAAFVKLAFPGLLKLAGAVPPAPQKVTAILESSITGQRSWTQAVFGSLESNGADLMFRPIIGGSRLKAIANASGLVTLPEGEKVLEAGTRVQVDIFQGPMFC